MLEKKLVIKLKYGASALPGKQISATNRPPEYSWNLRRIAIAFGIALTVFLVLAYSFFATTPDREVGGLSAESVDSSPSEAKSGQHPPHPSSSPETQSTSGRFEGNSDDEAAPFSRRPDLKENKDPATATNGLTVSAPAPRASEKILRAQFTWGIKDNEPSSTIAGRAILRPGHSVALYFFSEFKDMKGQTAVHEWSHQGRTAFTKEFEVGDDRWKVFSSKRLNSRFLGEWKVTVRNSKGENLGEFVLEVLEPGK